ncbi:MAG: hypothetical protein IJ458_04255 [Clostridia bacterium]|nr:hypothetical protein [Clostridia bacterium]MBQ8522848.1 hypothetical protein [Clostridia bacterium]
MEDKKPRALDIARLIIAIITLIGALIVGIYLFLSVYQLFIYDGEDTISGLIFIFIIPLMIGAFVYSIISIKWIKKYNNVKTIPLSQRTTTTGECIVKIVLAIFFLSYLCIPFVIYWSLDLIEAVMHKQLAEKLKQSKHEPQFKTNETNPISDKHYCKYCGKEVDYRYARFCEHCGAEIEFRK